MAGPRRDCDKDGESSATEAELSPAQAEQFLIQFINTNYRIQVRREMIALQIFSLSQRFACLEMLECEKELDIALALL